MSSLSGANRITAPVASRAVMPMLVISQKPDRVSNILRSSTPTSRVIGIGVVRPWSRRRRRRLSLDGDGAHAAAPSRWVSAVSSRNISSSPAPSADRSSVRATPAVERDLADARRVGVGAQRRRRPRGGGDAGGRERRGERAGVALRTTVPAACQQVGLGALRDDPAVADHDEVVGDDLDLVQQVRGQQHGAALVGVRPGAGRASSGCPPGRGRWPARRGSAPPGRR